jgi:hypothetical protein
MVVIIKFLCSVLQGSPNLYFSGRTVFTSAYEPRLENLVTGNPCNRKKTVRPHSKLQRRCWVVRARCIGV